jgi:hypothetical protein
VPARPKAAVTVRNGGALEHQAILSAATCLALSIVVAGLHRFGPTLELTALSLRQWFEPHML